MIVTVIFAVACQEKRAAEVPLTGKIVEYGRLEPGGSLRGVLYLPEGSGPFPVLLYAHGSARGSYSNEAFEAVAPEFTRRGWAVFAPYRRGQGLSSNAGRFVSDDIAAARKSGGFDAAQARLADLLANDHLSDQTRAFGWLSRQSFADRRRVAVMGNSFGGIIALLSADRLPVCAAVNAAGGADSWEESPALRRLMIGAATGANAPVLFMQAENDFDLAPSRALHVAMVEAGKPAEIRLYPAFGRTVRDGHSFPYKGVRIWSEDVRRFLSRACT